MTTLTRLQGFTLPLTEESVEAEREESRASGGSGRPTLERKLGLTWEGLLATGVASCPICSSRMERRAGAGRCGCCGTKLT
jgi:hypothetical protein